MEDSIRRFWVRLMYRTPILMHADNIEWADMMEEWQANNKDKSKPGDDRTPPWKWLGALYSTDPETGVICVPSENIMASLLAGAGEVPVKGKGRKTFRTLVPSAIMCTELSWPLLVGGKTISMADINAMKDFEKFSEHAQAARLLGFSLYAKRVTIKGFKDTKHIRVRPRFDNWSAEGELMVFDDIITQEILQNIVNASGRLKGLCDWRPSAPKKPGQWGTFTATVTPIKADKAA